MPDDHTGASSTGLPRRPQGVRERKKAETRKSLATAAAQLMLYEGSEGTTIASIARRADVSSRTFHNYFPHREAAFRYYIETFIDDVKVMVEESEPGQPVLEMLLGIAKKLTVDSPEGVETIYMAATLGEHLTMHMSKTEFADLLTVFERLTNAVYEYCEGRLSKFQIHLLINTGASAISALTEIESMTNYSNGRSFEALLEESFDLLANGFEPRATRTKG
ncbi:TetR/AcrR family transcriptional regulator [Corynebacterium heidelbergense]|uniref:TetR/AcrR family transcriptional regulator n=1 Tax=Corynebacterium heidelbergense TaxID=2055947 RepID=A0A364V3P5_9CORY|nr:TetR/AcrR family transcriptional regulator [Corynebacterium heidelbergense]RAV31254.1 TetR/AcrR family transcriptional regulator [Corynebacterium heidelbergense]